MRQLTIQEQPGMIELENIVKTYKMGAIEVHALRSVSLEVGKGQMVAIVGPSGSGKSTLMNILGCLDRPTSGQYFLDGVEATRLSDNELAVIRNKRIGFVFQTNNLLPRTPAVANVELPLIYGGGSNRRKRAMEALARVGLAERAHHRPNELSGGEQQRVAIARALINNPSIIIADEPTGNLDSRTGDEIMRIFQRLNKEDGITVILVTHDPDIANRTQRIIRLRDGEVSADERLDSTNPALPEEARP